MVYGLILLFLTTFPANHLKASGETNPHQPFTVAPSITQQDTTEQENLRLMILPILFRSPDTGFAFGVLPQLIFRTQSSTNPSTLRLDSYYTQKNQYHILLRSNNWISNDRVQVTGKVSVKKWPTSFYGIGNNTSRDLKESFTENLYEAEAGFRRRAGSNFFVGLGGSVRYAKISSKESGGLLAKGAIPGSENSFISGIDAGIVFDTRDNHFYPSSGSYHQLNLFGAPKFLGSDYSFTRATLDLRRYIPVTDSQVLAIQALGSFSGGDVPFRLLPSVGSSLRGYPSSRYIDKHSVSLQMEYRIVPLFWRIGFVFFAGTGDVFNSFKYIDTNDLKHMAGFGLRYVFFRDEKINIRFDVSFGRQSFGDYIDLTEAY